jgi:hypothetical protein
LISVTLTNITIITRRVATVSGYVGNYNVQISQHSRGVSNGDAEALLQACTIEAPDEFNYGQTLHKIIYRSYPGCYPASPAVDWDHYHGEPIQVNGKAVVLKDEPKTIMLDWRDCGGDRLRPYQPSEGEYGYHVIKKHSPCRNSSGTWRSLNGEPLV